MHETNGTIGRRAMLKAAAAGAALTAPGAALAATDTMADVKKAIAANHDAAVKRLQDWIRLPSIAAEDRGHSGGLCRRGSVGHGPTAFADEHHRLLGAEDTGGCGVGDLTDGVARAGRDDAEGVGRVGEEFQERHEASADDEWLRDRCVADRVRVGRGAVGAEVDA